jgi:hypothetical protein
VVGRRVGGGGGGALGAVDARLEARRKLYVVRALGGVPAGQELEDRVGDAVDVDGLGDHALRARESTVKDGHEVVTRWSRGGHEVVTRWSEGGATQTAPGGPGAPARAAAAARGRRQGEAVGVALNPKP